MKVQKRLPAITPKIITRFQSKTKKGSVPKHAKKLGNCIIWTGHIQKGYGIIRINKIQYRAHRVAMKIFAQQDFPEKEVAHRCDNKRCVRVGHLFWASHSENMDDLKQKGLHRPARGKKNGISKHPEVVQGENNGRAKLTAFGVSEIRRRAEQGDSQTELAKEFGVGHLAINRIVRRASWKSVK